MKDWSNPAEVARQYASSKLLQMRILLHQRFSTNQQGWFPWVFEQLSPNGEPLLPTAARLVEVGSGTGELWLVNGKRVPSGWRLTLSDLSWGMVRQAARQVGAVFPVHSARIDAGHLPFATASLDAVIANHMLYHVPDRGQALAEIRRALKPGGRLFATTLGRLDKIELLRLLEGFNPHLADQFRYKEGMFFLENGAEEVARHFPTVSVSYYPDSLHVTEVEPLVDYIFSTCPEQAPGLGAALTAYLQVALRQGGGAIDITKVAGMIIAS